ncbi:copper amine oxidase N-terminal domain-containing protein [Paenibacillus sp. YPG26]|uniref:copper amine oxidase N-terminal domain-containing protein n=1 Tax=Paenibacillus sp. YPG26 TaxID=2878915 RepID=UPI002041DA1E|nr:copper amine oxidase N-terminal domain-containing protein [Paenibacillus sp. YPG26]USB31765.1 copper amine oxidase N-terminal domain-containing protein [Paenibacillus sp. YPG26]
MKSKMMKCILLTVLSLGLSATPILNLNTAAAASTPAAKPIRVYVHNKEVRPSSSPIIRHGRVFVELRSILKTLDYTLSYDSKKKIFSAVSEDKTIKIDMKSGKANLNGQAFPNDSKNPYVIIGASSTFVDLEFLNEATGLEAEWDQAGRMVKVHKSTYGPPLKADLREMTALVKKMLKAIKDGDSKTYLSLINKESDSEFYERVIEDPSLLTKYAGYSSIDNLSSDPDYYPSEQKFNVELSIPKGPGELLDRIEHLGIYMELDKNYKWTFGYLESEHTEYANFKEVLKKEAEVPEADKTAIHALFDTFIKAMNEKDVEAALSTLNTDSTTIKDVKKSLFATFGLSDFEIIAESMSIAAYANNSATIYLVQNFRLPESGMELRVYNLIKAIKLPEGSWRIIPDDAVSLDMDVLNDSYE